jgi:hypothetical protein
MDKSINSKTIPKSVVASVSKSVFLTDECKEKFLRYISFTHGLDETDFELKKQVFLNALIIEFFDSVGIYISIHYVDFVNKLTSAKGFEGIVTHGHLSTRFREVGTRLEATKAGIEKANEIYNAKVV